MPTTTTPIFVGLPVFRGWQYIGDALRSLQSQSWTDFRVLISVDGADQRTADACRPFLRDSRLQIKVHDTRLGWTENFNWLLERSDADFFCYFQQDDLLDPAYFSKLLDAAARHPSAAVLCSGLQFFGTMDGTVPASTILGEVPDRIAAQIAELNFVPLRGLIRNDALRMAGPLRDVDESNFGADLIWIAKLASAGEIHGVPDYLYFKRWHDSNTSKRWWDWPQERRRKPFIRFWIGMLAAVLPSVPSREDRYQLFFRVLERVAVDNWFYDSKRLLAPERYELIVEFLTSLRSVVDFGKNFDASEPALLRIARRHFGLRPSPTAAVKNPQSSISKAFRAMRKRRQIQVNPLAPASSEVRYQLGSEIDFSNVSSKRFLQGGWGNTESWGTWTTGPVAELTLWPDLIGPPALRLRACVHAFLHGNHNRVSVHVTVEGRPIALWRFNLPLPQSDAPRWRDVKFRAPAWPLRIAFLIDRPASPASLGTSPDKRALGMGLHKLSVEPA
jgi:glycosyltransferase involved in cell wall biosynthesis